MGLSLPVFASSTACGSTRKSNIQAMPSKALRSKLLSLDYRQSGLDLPAFSHWAAAHTQFSSLQVKSVESSRGFTKYYFSTIRSDFEKNLLSSKWEYNTGM